MKLPTEGFIDLKSNESHTRSVVIMKPVHLNINDGELYVFDESIRDWVLLDEFKKGLKE